MGQTNNNRTSEDTELDAAALVGVVMLVVDGVLDWEEVSVDVEGEVEVAGGVFVVEGVEEEAVEGAASELLLFEAGVVGFA